MQQPALDARALEALVSAAVAAPSIHNTQPWRFRLDADTRTFEVRAAPERSLPLTDPAARALHLSVGAAVLNLRVAAAHLGWEPVMRLLPRPQDPGLLAAVRLAGPPRPGAGPDLYQAIWRRHTSRLPFSGTPVPGDALAELADTARLHGVTLQLPGPAETARILALTGEAERRNTTDPARRAEARAWITQGQGGYGIPEDALGPQDASGRIPVRDFLGLSAAHHRPPMAFEDDPHLLLLTTTHDQRADWLRTGLAMEHALLLLTTRGLRASMLYQALEWPDLRWLLRDPGTGPAHPQMLLRIGYGPEGPATPRRTAAESLLGAAESLLGATR